VKQIGQRKADKFLLENGLVIAFFGDSVLKIFSSNISVIKSRGMNGDI
jgi:hypothetical protein